MFIGYMENSTTTNSLPLILMKCQCNIPPKRLLWNDYNNMRVDKSIDVILVIINIVSQHQNNWLTIIVYIEACIHATISEVFSFLICRATFPNKTTQNPV